MQEPSYLGETTLAPKWFRMTATQTTTRVCKEPLTLTYRANTNIRESQTRNGVYLYLTRTQSHYPWVT